MSEVNLAALAESGKCSKDFKPSTPMSEIDDALMACSFGWFHCRLLFTSFVGLSAGMMVSVTTGFLLPVAECDLDMDLVQKGTLNAMAYIGMLFSSVIAGFLTDTFGRKIFLLVGYGGIFVFTVVAGSSQTYAVLATAKFFEGVLFATSFGALVSLTSEFCHKGIRDRVMLCQSSFLALAAIVASAMTWGILIQHWEYSLFGGSFVLHTWNFYLYIVSLWSFAACVLYLFLPESPKYLVTQRKYDEAREILIQVYMENTGKTAESYPADENLLLLPIHDILLSQASVIYMKPTLPCWPDELAQDFMFKNIWKDKSKYALDEAEEADSNIRHQLIVGLHNIKPMFRKPLVMTLAKICFTNFIIMATYNLLRLWFPQLSTIVEHYKFEGDQRFCDVMNKYTADLKITSNVTKIEVCIPTKSGNKTYINSIVIGCVSLLPYFITGVLVNRVGKKPLLIVAGLVSIATVLGLLWAKSMEVTTALFAIGVAITQVMMSLNQTIMIEVFPTNTRTLALALMMVSGRLGVLLYNVAFPILLNMECIVPFYTMSALLACVTFVSLFLPKK